MTCTDCTRAASTWNWHGYRNGCADCEIRAIAQAPRQLRELRYDQLRRKLPAAEVQAVIERVKEEYQRIRNLRGTT